MEDNRSSRLDEIDVMRGFGILLVVIGHVWPVGTWIHSFIYSFHMPLFFIISGLTLSIGKGKPLFTKTDRRLGKEYFLYSTLFIVFDIVIRMLAFRTYTKIDIYVDLLNTVSLFGISVLWFLPTIICARVLARVVIFYSKRQCFFLLRVCLLLLIIGIRVPYHEYQTWDAKMLLVLQRILSASSYVIVGFLIRKYLFTKIKSLKLFIPAGLINILLADVVNGADFRTLSCGGDVILPFILSICGTLMIVGVSSAVTCCRTKLMGYFKYLSSQSLRIMVLHSYLMIPGLIDIALKKAGISQDSIIYYSVKTIALITIVLLICKFVDRVQKRGSLMLHTSW